MPFWSDPNLSEPLRQNRWYIQFSNLSDYQYALKSCSKPEYDIGVSEHVLLNHTFRYPKNLVWKPISVKMVAVTAGKNANETLSSKINSILLDSYSTPSDSKTTSEGFLSKNSLSSQNINICQLDANGNIIEKWYLINSFISNVKYGNLSYDNDGFVDIDLTLQYDYATLVNERIALNEEGVKRNNFTIFGLDTGINNFLEPKQKKTFTPGFPGDKK